MKSIEASSTCVGRITDGRVSKAIYTLLSFSIQDKEKGSSNAAGGSSCALPWAQRRAMAEGRRNPATADGDGDGDAMHLLIKGQGVKPVKGSRRTGASAIYPWLATACPAPTHVSSLSHLAAASSMLLAAHGRLSIATLAASHCSSPCHSCPTLCFEFHSMVPSNTDSHRT